MHPTGQGAVLRGALPRFALSRAVGTVRRLRPGRLCEHGAGRSQEGIVDDPHALRVGSGALARMYPGGCAAAVGQSCFRGTNAVFRPPCYYGPSPGNKGRGLVAESLQADLVFISTSLGTPWR